MRYCCEKCFSNKYLKEYILSERNVGKCDYCNSNGVNIISTGEIGAYIRECLKKAYEDIRLRVKRGEKDIIKAHAESKGISLNAYINDLIEKDMKEKK